MGIEQAAGLLQDVLASVVADGAQGLGVGHHHHFVQAGRLLHVGEQEVGAQAILHQPYGKPHLVQRKFRSVDGQQDSHGGHPWE